MRKRYVAVLLAAYLCWVVSYELVGHTAARLPTLDLTCAFDRAIPLWPPAVWAYEAAYLLPFAPVLLARDFHRINVWLIACLLANIGAFVVYLALPIAFPRPELGHSPAEQVLALEYRFDFHPGANNLPSMHVTLSWLAVFACAKQGRTPLLLAALALLASLITLSTLLVKQHLLGDVLAGVVWALSSWHLAAHLYRRRSRPHLPPLSNLRAVLSRPRS